MRKAQIGSTALIALIVVLLATSGMVQSGAAAFAPAAAPEEPATPDAQPATATEAPASTAEPAATQAPAATVTPQSESSPTPSGTSSGLNPVPTPGAEPGQGTLRVFDAGEHEAECDAHGTCRAIGTAQIDYDSGSHTLSYHLSFQGAAANATYLVDAIECNTDTGDQLSRGFGGQVQTNGSGAGTLDGTWVVQTNTEHVKLALLRACDAGDGGPPVIPCDDTGFAIDALVPAGR